MPIFSLTAELQVCYLIHTTVLSTRNEYQVGNISEILMKPHPLLQHGWIKTG